MSECSYCRTEHSLQRCPRCGAPANKPVEQQANEKYAPFFFLGFMIFPESTPDSFWLYHIWAGDRYIGRVDVSNDMRLAYADAYPGASPEPLIEKLMRLTLGETEVEEYRVKNQPRQLLFEIRRTESPEFEEARRIIKELIP